VAPPKQHKGNLVDRGDFVEVGMGKVGRSILAIHKLNWGETRQTAGSTVKSLRDAERLKRFPPLNFFKKHQAVCVWILQLSPLN
jgi:hypothetical protein